MSRVLAKINDQTSRLEWLQLRQKGIGGSDVAGILGMSSWKSPIDVWLDKTQEITADDGASEAAYWGTVLEDIVAKEFCQRTGLQVRRRNAILMHDVHDCMLANIDREIVGQRVGLECKTASAYKKGEWQDEEIPAAYILQCQHYMAVTGYEAWWIACLIGGNKFVYKLIERDEEFIQMLIKAEVDFWEQYVIANQMPPADGSKASADILKTLYSEAENGKEIVLDSEDEKLLQERESLNELYDQTENRIKEIENLIKQKMGKAEIGMCQSYNVKWSNTSRSTIDSKKLKAEQPDIYQQYLNTTTSRRFTVKEVV